MKKTPLHQKHKELDAKMGEFAGYDMPLFYPEGVIKEHQWVRSHAGLFDVSHMGQIIVEGPGATAFWEHITPSSFGKMKNDAARYTVLTGEEGGILDDLIVTRLKEDKFFAVVNAGRKTEDFAWLQKNLPDGVTLRKKTDHALIALQGPAAAKVLFDEFGLDTSAIDYMTGQVVGLGDAEAYLSRLGYTGEDGFEISVEAEKAPSLWDSLLRHDDVKPIGLAARDSLRLEMGYCLYGHDIDETITPPEAGLRWVISKNNTAYIGAQAIAEKLEKGTKQKRVGFRLLDKGVAREGMNVLDESGHIIGRVTSGGFSPTLQKAIGQAYVEKSVATVGNRVQIEVRGRPVAAEIAAMPFVAPKTKAS